MEKGFIHRHIAHYCINKIDASAEIASFLHIINLHFSLNLILSSFYEQFVMY